MQRLTVGAAATLAFAAAAMTSLAGAAERAGACGQATDAQRIACAEGIAGPMAARVATALQAARSASPRVATLNADHALWRRSLARSGQSREDLEDEFERRVEELDRLAAADRSMPRRATMQQVANTCLSQALKGCTVTQSGTLSDKATGARLAWQIQGGFTDEDGVMDGIVILVPEGADWRPVSWTFGGHDFSTPQLTKVDDSILLHVRGKTGGSGGYNADLLLQQRNAQWHDIELVSWWQGLDAKLPNGLGVWQGVDYDFANLMATSFLWRQNDGNCCPTGGAALLSFDLMGDSLVLDEVRPSVGAAR